MKALLETLVLFQERTLDTVLNIKFIGVIIPIENILHIYILIS